MIKLRALGHVVIGARMLPPGAEFDAPPPVARHLLRHGAAEVVFPEADAAPPAPEPAPEPPPPPERRHAPTHGRRRR